MISIFCNANAVNKNKATKVLYYTAAQIMTALGLKSKENLRKLYIGPALENGLIVMGLPDKPTSRNQTYIRV